MKLRMAENSLFAILLRSRWWASASVAVAIALLAWFALPPDWRLTGVLAGLPFVVIAALAAWRQRRAPSPAQIEQATQVLRGLAWPAFAALLEQSFRRDGHAATRRDGAADFVLERKGRRMLVSARRWKAARTGLDALRELQVARDAAEAPDALYIALGELSEPAAAFAREQRIAVWRAEELAQALRGLLPRHAP